MIVDTGVIYADIDRSDDWHTSAAALLSTAPGPLRVPALVVTEVCYLLQVRLGPVACGMTRWIDLGRAELLPTLISAV